MRPSGGEHSNQDHIDRTVTGDRLHHGGTISQDDRMHHSGLDERAYYTIDERLQHRFHEGDERLRHYDHDTPGDDRVHQHLDSQGEDGGVHKHHDASIDDRLHQYHDHLVVVRDGGRQNQQIIEGDNQKDEHLHQHPDQQLNAGQSREVDLSSYSLRGATGSINSSSYHITIRSAQQGREYDQTEHQQDGQHYNPH